MKIDYVRKVLTSWRVNALTIVEREKWDNLFLALLDYYEMSRKYGQYPDEMDADEAVERRMEEL